MVKLTLWQENPKASTLLITKDMVLRKFNLVHILSINFFSL